LTFVVLALTLATAATGAGQRTTVSIDFNGVVGVTAHSERCPPGGPPGLIGCYLFEAQGNVPGLGEVWYSHRSATAASVDGFCPHVYIGHIAMIVSGAKYSGELDLSFSVNPVCNGVPTGFVINGGTGDFAGASGSGTFVPNLFQSGRTETWAGSVTFGPPPIDVTPPVISGAHSRTVIVPKGARRVRVRFRVRATDKVDGRVDVWCLPRSGSRFRIGRTRVRCWAADYSGNTAEAHFTITVRRSGSPARRGSQP
jgi:hypothetical protein